jgi:thymidylate kinase
MNSEADTIARIQALEKKASAVLDAKRKVLSRRPIVIEFSGTPKSGKSSSISSLDIFLRRNNFKTKVLTERASVCPIENKFDPLFNVWNGCAAINQLAEIVANRPKEYDVVIMDRGFFDSLCWFEWQKMNGFLGEEDYKRFKSFFTAPRFRMMVDLVIHFDAMPETSMEREYKNLLTRKQGSVMRDNVLEGYRTSAEAAKKWAAPLFRQFVEVKTDDLNQNAVGVKVTELCLEKLQDVAKEKICYVPKDGLETLFNGPTAKFSDLECYFNDNMAFDDREIVEDDDTKVQLLPIAILKDKREFEFVVARKGKTATSKNSPEQNRILMYFGGHVREEDKTLYDETEMMGVLHQCVFRELKEELGIDVMLTDKDAVCVWHRDGARSEQHIAIAFIVERDLDYTKLNIDDREFVRLTKKEKYGTGARINRDGIWDQFDKIDAWSKEVLKSVYGDDLKYLDRGNDLFSQNP